MWCQPTAIENNDNDIKSSRGGKYLNGYKNFRPHKDLI